MDTSLPSTPYRPASSVPTLSGSGHAVPGKTRTLKLGPGFTAAPTPDRRPWLAAYQDCQCDREPDRHRLEPAPASDTSPCVPSLRQHPLWPPESSPPPTRLWDAYRWGPAGSPLARFPGRRSDLSAHSARPLDGDRSPDINVWDPL